MKTLVLLLISLTTLHKTYAQQQPETGSSIRTDYLAKSRTNRTAGFIFLGGGAAMTVGGIIGTENSESLDFGPATVALVGIGAMLASIPFFIIASSQSAKAARLSGGIKLEKKINLVTGTKNFANYPALVFRFSLP